MAFVIRTVRTHGPAANVRPWYYGPPLWTQDVGLATLFEAREEAIKKATELTLTPGVPWNDSLEVVTRDAVRDGSKEDLAS